VIVASSGAVFHFGRVVPRAGEGVEARCLNAVFRNLKGDLVQDRMWPPVEFPRAEKVVQVACGAGHILALTHLKKLYSWGWG
jgi:alpha-tubulin suppressor-like RCC1 family protein